MAEVPIKLRNFWAKIGLVDGTLSSESFPEAFSMIQSWHIIGFVLSSFFWEFQQEDLDPKQWVSSRMWEDRKANGPEGNEKLQGSHHDS